MKDLFEQLAQRPRGGELERLGEILPRVFVALARHVDDTVTRVLLPATLRAQWDPGDDVQPGPGPDPDGGIEKH
jgi:hypothetical protein